MSRLAAVLQTKNNFNGLEKWHCNATKLIFIKCANKVVTNNIEGEASATEKQVFQSAILRDLVSLWMFCTFLDTAFYHSRAVGGFENSVGFKMNFHLHNVVLFRNVLSFSKYERFYEFLYRMLLQIFGFFCDWLSSVYIQCLVTVKCWFFFLSGSWGPITSLPVLWSSAESNERVSFLATFEHLSPFAASFTSHVMGLDMFCKKCFLDVI